MTELGNRLKAAREAKNLNHRELSARAVLPSGEDGEPRTVGARHIGMIESGERENLTAEIATALCEALGCSLDWLLLGKGDAPAGVKAA